jgi:hypothetical protein
MRSAFPRAILRVPGKGRRGYRRRLDVMADTLTRGQIQDLLSKFSKNNPKYRAALLKNPKAVVEGQLNNKLPANIKVKTVEETADTIYVVVPYVPQSGKELGDAALEMVAGGSSKGGSDNYDCHSSTGGFNTRNEFNAEVKLI